MCGRKAMYIFILQCEKNAGRRRFSGFTAVYWSVGTSIKRRSLYSSNPRRSQPILDTQAGNCPTISPGKVFFKALDYYIHTQQDYRV